jgi:hypothetical protein
MSCVKFVFCEELVKRVDAECFCAEKTGGVVDAGELG